jgi:hypothetical protein
MEHEKYCTPSDFSAIVNSTKKAYIYPDPCAIKTGHIIFFREIVPLEGKYTGQSCHVLITECARIYLSQSQTFVTLISFQLLPD